MHQTHCERNSARARPGLPLHFLMCHPSSRSRRPRSGADVWGGPAAAAVQQVGRSRREDEAKVKLRRGGASMNSGRTSPEGTQGERVTSMVLPPGQVFLPNHEAARAQLPGGAARGGCCPRKETLQNSTFQI